MSTFSRLRCSPARPGWSAGPPISRELAILGAAAAVAISFVVLVLAWRQPRYDAATSGRPAPAWLAAFVDSAWWRGLLRLVGLLALIYLVVVAVSARTS